MLREIALKTANTSIARCLYLSTETYLNIDKTQELFASALVESTLSNLKLMTMQTKSSKLQKKFKTNGAPFKRVLQNSKLMDLFEDQLKDILWSEKELIKSIPRMISLAASVELIEALTSHLDQTKEQVSRLAQVFRSIEIKPSTHKCEAMEGLIAEATKMLEDCEKGPWCDANIIAAAQKIDHYEIATYGTLIELANTMGLLDAAKLLELSLKEEKLSDNILTVVARDYVNVDAAALRG